MTASTGTCVFILGMHRSGTSAVAGVLREAGLYLGDVLDNGFALNPKGLHEPASLIYMHERLLEDNGGAWHDPPKTIVWDKMHCAVRDLFIESRRGQALWGFKEPRSLLVLEGWQEALPQWRGIGVFRDPLEVARSLERRNGFGLEKGFGLWRHYNEILLDLAQKHVLPLVEFNRDHDRFIADLGHFSTDLGLRINPASAFFDRAIPRTASTADTQNPPPECLRLYDALRAHANAMAHG